MIRGLIFDLGNTLMYFEGDWAAAAAQGRAQMIAYFAERGYPLPVSFEESFRGLRETGSRRVRETNVEYTAQDALSDALAQHSICWIPEAVLPRAVEKYFETEMAQWRAYEDARRTLERLRERGLKLALLSNATDHTFIERIAANARLAEFFHPLLSSAQISHRKPDPRAFQPILNAWQIPPREIVMVGDAASYDILGAHRAGMRGVLIEDRWDTPLEPHVQLENPDEMKPDAVIRQLAELPAVIDEFDAKDMVNG